MEIPWHDYTENDGEVLIQQAGLIEKHRLSAGLV